MTDIVEETFYYIDMFRKSIVRCFADLWRFMTIRVVVLLLQFERFPHYFPGISLTSSLVSWL